MMQGIRLLLVIGAVAALAGCAQTNAIRDAESLVAAGQYEEGMAQLEAQARGGEKAKEAKVALLRNKAIVSEKLEREAALALESDRFELAEKLYQRSLAIEPTNEKAKSGLARLQATRVRAERLAKAEDMLRKNDLEGAERAVREILTEAPGYRGAIALEARIAERQRKKSPLAPELGPEFAKVISLEFRDANLKSVFDAVWSASGVNFILDRDVRNDAKVSIFVRDVTVAEAVDALLVTQQLAKKVVSSKTLLIYPKTPQKLAEYQDLVVRNFFLAHADAKQVQLLLKTILKIKDVFIDEKRNLVVIRDSQEGVDLAEKLVRAHDQADPEVMLALDVIEIKRSKLNDLGVNFANQIALGMIGSPLTLQAVRDLNSSGISIGFGTGSSAGTLGTVNLTNNAGDTRLLANPRIRVRNREKAKIHIGDRLPVVTTAVSTVSTFSSQTVNYLDVGLKLEVEPQVMLDDDVIIKLNLEVSSATQSKVNPTFYDVGTRNTATTLTIRDGETQILAGLIRDDEIEATSKLPGLGDLPVLGRLFSNQRRSQDKNEIILAITPRVIRNLVRPNADLAEYKVGTESGRHDSGSAGVPVAPVRPSPAPAPRPQVPTSGSAGTPFTAVPGSAAVTAPGVAPGGLGVGGAVASPAVPTSPVAPAPPAVGGTARPSSGVIPLIEFETPPGVGSTRGTR